MSNLRKLLLSLAALTLVGAACGSDDSGPGVVLLDRDELGTAANESVPPAAEAPADDESEVLRPGLQVTSVDFATGVAVITNLGERDVDLTGHWICNRPNYAELPSGTLVPGDSVEASLGGFSVQGGEVAIYTSDGFGDPNEISTYVGWGSGGGRQPVAEEAGIWTGDPVQPAGDAIELTGDPGSATGWT
jgi:hypothetical protein